VKLAIGLIVSPTYSPPAEFFAGWPGAPEPTGLLATLQTLQTGQVTGALGPVTASRLIVSRLFPTDVARNEICASVLEQGDDALVFMDTDMIHPASWLPRLLAHDVPVITARYHARKPPFLPIVYLSPRSGPAKHTFAPVHLAQGLIEIERGGAGALVIRREVLQAIYDRQGHNWFRYQRATTPPFDYQVSEDFWFYEQARRAGFQCYCDWDVVCGHMQALPIDGDYAQPFLERELAQAERDRDACQRIRDRFLVCGYPGGLTLPDGSVVPESVALPEAPESAEVRA
jgi:hypothetical protein